MGTKMLVLSSLTLSLLESLTAVGSKGCPGEVDFPPSAYSKHQELQCENTTFQWCLPASAGEWAGCTPCWLHAWPEVFPSVLWLLTPPWWVIIHMCAVLLLLGSEEAAVNVTQQKRKDGVEPSNLINCFRLYFLARECCKISITIEK